MNTETESKRALRASPAGVRFRDFEARVARLSEELSALERPVPAATLRSITDLDGDFGGEEEAEGGHQCGP